MIDNSIKDDDVMKRFRFSKDSWEYIQDYAKKNNIPYDNRTINHIIQEHKEFISTDSDKGDHLIDNISERISKEVNKEIRRIRLGTNNTDRNTQVIIELLNGLFVDQNINDILTTEDMESKPVHTAKTVVQERIQHLQQKRSDYFKGGERNEQK